ncbi:MAG TPA: SUMF1/EgtB/PvdO family nonheme iron enzyme [Vicinamibacterales bacterium]|nr:SUMF1/EgtB/PvdO family nonheme iron enzyme [Vicinamibacterales bacterium]
MSSATSTGPLTVDRAAAAAWYARNRSRSRALFDLIDPAAYYARPIPLRNPIVFYEGHLPAFSIIALIQRGLGQSGVDARLEQLFARGIDPETEDAAAPRSGADTSWPSRDEVLAFGGAADALITDAILRAPFDESRPAMRGAEALYTALEHEAMHQETLLYMWHRLPHAQKRRPAYLPYEAKGDVPPRATLRIPAGVATLGARRSSSTFGWDNEFDAHQVEVPAFDVDVHSVTNADYLPFVEAGHVEPPAFWLRDGGAWFWRGMFENIPLPPAWPVYVSQADAAAFAAARGRRLLSEAEYHRAAFGTPAGDERRHPWGSAVPDRSRGHFDFALWDPVPAGARPAGASAWGVHDLVGNGWEWTSTIFAPFPGFEPMVSYPEYSAEFFDGQHYVMKGASSGTARELIRPSFRNWFRSNYPYVYAKFRTAAAL